MMVNSRGNTMVFLLCRCEEDLFSILAAMACLQHVLSMDMLSQHLFQLAVELTVGCSYSLHSSPKPTKFLTRQTSNFVPQAEEAGMVYREECFSAPKTIQRLLNYLVPHHDCDLREQEFLSFSLAVSCHPERLLPISICMAKVVDCLRPWSRPLLKVLEGLMAFHPASILHRSRVQGQGFVLQRAREFRREREDGMEFGDFVTSVQLKIHPLSAFFGLRLEIALVDPEGKACSTRQSMIQGGRGQFYLL